jgi:iron complex outermembrane receptor protein
MLGASQMAHAEAASGETAIVETVVVTAQKREQNVQDVPLAVQVVGGAQLAAAGVQDFTNLARVSPNLVIRSDVQPVNATVSIRGVGTNAFGIGVEPSVAVQVDDVPLAFQARAFSDLSDIERIEVLSGPQSTLYGKSASAGLINIVTNAPSRSLTASASAMTTSDSESGGTVMVSGPLTSNLGFRVNANYDAFEGNVDNRFNGHKVNGSEIFSTRGKLVWDPTDRLNVTLGLDFIKGQSTTGRPFIALSPTAALQPGVFKTGAAAPTPTVAPLPSVFNAGITAGPENTSVNNDYETSTAYQGAGQSLKASLDLGFATLMSITGHARFDLKDHQDIDESGLSAYRNDQTGDFINTQWTQELRLVSPSKQPFRYTLGLFYADVDYTRHFLRGPLFSLARWDATEASKQQSVFGQVEYDLTPKFTMIGGVRYGSERISYTFLDYRAGPAKFAGHSNDNYDTYKVGFQVHLTDDIMLFASNSTGHKGPTYDLTTGFNQNRANGGPVRPETSVAYEAGIRAQFLDHRLTINPTIFQTDYSGFQAQGIQVLPDGTTNFRLSNVGSVAVRGVEIESAYRASRNLTINASVAYLDAMITDFSDAQCYPGQTAALGCIPATTSPAVPAHQNLANTTLPQAPEWKLTASFDYARPINGGALTLLARGSYTYQSDINYALTHDPQANQKGYSLVNLSAGVRDPAKRWELIAFVNNLFGEKYYAGLVNSQSGYGNQQALQAIIPRDFKTYGGVRLTVKY